MLALKYLPPCWLYWVGEKEEKVLPCTLSLGLAHCCSLGSGVRDGGMMRHQGFPALSLVSLLGAGIVPGGVVLPIQKLQAQEGSASPGSATLTHSSACTGSPGHQCSSLILPQLPSPPGKAPVTV